MNLRQYLKPWQGTGYRHQPANSPYPVTDSRFLGMNAGRWSRKGEKAYYVACDPSVMATEFARWLKTEAGAVSPSARDVFELEIQLNRVLDLRDPQVQAALGITSVTDFFHVDHCQTYAAMARINDAEAILVPPMGTLDKPETWNLVVFTEAFNATTSFVQRHRHMATIEVKPA